MKKLIVLAGVLVILAGCAGEKPVFRMEEKKELTAAEQNRLKAQEAAQRLQMEKELEMRLGALVREPMSAEAHHKVAYQCYVMGNTEKAVDYWQKALKLDPKHAKSLYSLGVLNHKLSRGDKALELWEKTIVADANFWQAYYNIGVEYHNRSQFQKAADYYGMALKVKPDHAKSYVNLGLAYFELFRDKDMVAAWEEGLKHVPDDVYLNYNLGSYWAGKIQNFANVNYRDQDPQSKEYLSRAVEYWRKALNVNAEEMEKEDVKRGMAMVNYSLGEYYDYIEDLDEAVDYMRKAYELDPASPQIKHRFSALSRQKRWGGRS